MAHRCAIQPRESHYEIHEAERTPRGSEMLKIPGRHADEIDLHGRHALVTGASGGIGTAIVRALVDRGAHVVATGRRADALDELARATGAEPVCCDLADRDQLLRLLERVPEMDVVISNAGIPASGKLEGLTFDQIDRALDVNLRAPLLLARAASIAMRERRRGHVVIMSSISGKLFGGSQAVYCATKAGLRAATIAMREDLHGTGITVSVILPGPVSDAGMWADAELPLPPGVGTSTPEEVAAAVLRAMAEDRLEIDVCTPKLRAMATLALVRPNWVAAKGKPGSAEFGEMMTKAHSVKW